MTETKKVAIRLAFRTEGDWWVCYAAQPNTMEGALKMGTVAMGIVLHEGRKHMFMRMMKSALADFVEEKFGKRPDTWETSPGPESEQSGSA